MAEVLIVGAGPAGIAAARAAAAGGAAVTLMDDNPAPGGQIWRGDKVILPCSFVTGYAKAYPTPLILATGARERFLPFPGWTLPGVTGAGGLQALVKGGLPIANKRVIVAGTGPLLLAVAAYLKSRGAKVVRIVEQAEWSRIREFGMSMFGEPSRLLQAFSLKLRLLRVPYTTGCWPVAADGNRRLEVVRLRRGDKTWMEGADYLACGFGLVPNLELPLLLGCDLREGFVAVNEQQESSVTGVYCAGEITGVGGVEKAIGEGRIAGSAAAGKPLRAVSRSRRFVQQLAETFALREELRTIASPETIVCRCEDVTLGTIQPFSGWREAKLQTRCGMGTCQGRVCGPALEFLRGWQTESVRPPVFPTKVNDLI